MVTIFLALAICVCIPSSTEADKIEPHPTGKARYMLIADVESAKWGISPIQVKGVLKAESGYSQTAIGDRGLARSCAQYHKDTFNHYENLYFKTNGEHLQYLSCTDQIKLMTWQWKVFPRSKLEWSTYRRLYLPHGRYS